MQAPLAARNFYILFGRDETKKTIAVVKIVSITTPKRSIPSVMCPIQILVNIGPGNCSLPDDTKLLPEWLVIVIQSQIPALNAWFVQTNLQVNNNIIYIETMIHPTFIILFIDKKHVKKDTFVIF